MNQPYVHRSWTFMAKKEQPVCEFYRLYITFTYSNWMLTTCRDMKKAATSGKLSRNLIALTKEANSRLNYCGSRYLTLNLIMSILYVY